MTSQSQSSNQTNFLLVLLSNPITNMVTKHRPVNESSSLLIPIAMQSKRLQPVLRNSTRTRFVLSKQLTKSADCHLKLLYGFNNICFTHKSVTTNQPTTATTNEGEEETIKTPHSTPMTDWLAGWLKRERRNGVVLCGVFSSSCFKLTN